MRTDIDTAELKRIGYGVECQVYEVNSKIVCKVFKQRYKGQNPQPKRAEFAYRMQRIAYRYSLAPRPLAIEYNQYYSERVESFDILRYNGSWYAFKGTQEFQEFIDQMFEILGDYRDSHSGNIARLPNGKLCCIDFGVCGFKHSKIGKLLAEKIGIEIEGTI